jgi:hypothetical protein
LLSLLFILILILLYSINTKRWLLPPPENT